MTPTWSEMSSQRRCSVISRSLSLDRHHSRDVQCQKWRFSGAFSDRPSSPEAACSAGHACRLRVELAPGSRCRSPVRMISVEDRSCPRLCSLARGRPVGGNRWHRHRRRATVLCGLGTEPRWPALDTARGPNRGTRRMRDLRLFSVDFNSSLTLSLGHYPAA